MTSDTITIITHMYTRYVTMMQDKYILLHQNDKNLEHKLHWQQNYLKIKLYCIWMNHTRLRWLHMTLNYLQISLMNTLRIQDNKNTMYQHQFHTYCKIYIQNPSFLFTNLFPPKLILARNSSQSKKMMRKLR